MILRRPEWFTGEHSVSRIGKPRLSVSIWNVHEQWTVSLQSFMMGISLE